MKVIVAAVAGALISGSAVYVAGTKSPTGAPVEVVVSASPAAFESVQPAALVSRPLPRRAVTRDVAYEPAPAPRASASPTVVRESRDERVARAEPKRTWKQSAMIIGGGAVTGAAVGGLTQGRKGAAIGAAIGGGAASVYEVLQRR
jgi:hypothetical protein